MKLTLRQFVLLLLAQIFSLGAAVASDQVIEKPVTADTPERFAETTTQIRAAMSPGGRYEFIRPDDKAKVQVDLNTMAAMLQKAGSVGAMKEGEKVQLFNTQEHVNGILTHSDSNRLVCERVAPIGRSIPVNTCKTVAEVERARRGSQKYMQDQEVLSNAEVGAALHAGKNGH